MTWKFPYSEGGVIINCDIFYPLLICYVVVTCRMISIFSLSRSLCNILKLNTNMN